jgi:hypothetical protein
MANAVLTEQEKARIRHHTGYPLIDPVSSIVLGVPGSSQPMFLLELAMNRIPETAIGIIRNYIAVLDTIEQRLIDAQTRFSATKLGEITLRQDEPERIEAEYARWAKRLANDLGIPLNAFAERFNAGQGPAPMFIPRVH